MMNPVPWLQMTNMISYQGLVRTFLNPDAKTVVGTIGKGIGLAVDALISSGLQIISKL